MYVVLFDEVCEFLFLCVNAVYVELKNVDVVRAVCVGYCCGKVIWRWWWWRRRRRWGSGRSREERCFGWEVGT